MPKLDHSNGALIALGALGAMALAGTVSTTDGSPARSGDYPCSRCGGSGRIPAYMNVMSGVCFLCGGSGRQKTRPSRSVRWIVHFPRRPGETRTDIFDGPDFFYLVKARDMRSAIAIARTTLLSTRVLQHQVDPDAGWAELESEYEARLQEAGEEP